MPTPVACDARALADASAYRGIGTYLRQLLGGLAADARLEISALAPAGAPVPPGVRHVVVRRRAPDRWATLEHDLRLPAELARARPAVVHSPALDPPRRSPAPWVQTIHDVVPLAWPGGGLEAEARRWRRYGPRIRAASAVIAVSRHSARQAVELLGVEPNRIHVVPLAPEARFTPAPAGDGSRPPYVLMVAEYGPHKGYREAFAVSDALAEAGLHHTLKVAGRLTPATAPVVRSLVASSRAPHRIELLGFVGDLLPLYRGADAVLVSSRHEGFGLAAMEAMATGTPVVGFANSATAEVVAEGGRLVADGDVGALASSLVEVLRDRSRRDELSRAGIARAACFDWHRTVDQHAAILLAAAEAAS
ncbi:MAG TPA: glycosyltransferase family 1 protein [Acidimicrobiales bacterium]|nr:glycosyltransferase family 1 protein [Acidimicrobiales bacterium]